LSWTSSPGAFWYHIYRSDRPGFEAGPDTLLTYVAANTTSFRDNDLDLAGRKLTGTWYYRVTAVDKEDRESAATKAVAVAR
jgi:fibronectin type 3 domain-containing protein